MVRMSLINILHSVQFLSQSGVAHSGLVARQSLRQAKHCCHCSSGNLEHDNRKVQPRTYLAKAVDLESCTRAHQARFAAREHACRVSRLRRASAARRATTGALGRADVQAQPDGSIGVQSAIAGALPSLRACRPAASISRSMLYDGQSVQRPCSLAKLNGHK